MTFVLTVKETEADYKRPYTLKAERNVCFVLIFLVPFLAIIQIEYLFLTLVPWTLTGSIMILNYYSGRAPALTDPILIRDGYFEVDQYLSLPSALHDDRFVDLRSVDGIEAIQHVWRTRRKGEVKEMRRLVVHMQDGRTYTVDREHWLINNAVKALGSWAISLENDPKGQLMEGKVGITPFHCDRDELVYHGRNLASAIGIVLVSASAVIIFVILAFVGLAAGINDDPASFLFLTMIELVGAICFAFMMGVGLTNGFSIPRRERPADVEVREDYISIMFFSGLVTRYPWSSIRGIWAAPTEDYPHPFTLDSLFFSDQLGAIVFDNVLIYIKIDKIDKIQTIFVKKFGFYPDKYWFMPGGGRSPATDNYSILQKRPKMKWRKESS